MSKSRVITGPPDFMVPAHLSFGRLLLEKLVNGGNLTAVINADTGESTTYRQLLQWTVNAAVKLKQMGLRKGDIVGICSENRLEYLITMISCIFCGITVTTAGVAYSKGEMVHFLNLTKPKFIFCSPQAMQPHGDLIRKQSSIERIILFTEDNIIGADYFFKTLIRNHVDIETYEPEDANGQDTLAILCSSGSTGLPKGVMLTHLSFLVSAFVYINEKLDERGIFNVITFVPFHHAYGFMTILHYLICGRTVVFLPRFKEESFFKAIEKYKVNLALIVPTVAFIMSKSPLMDKYDLSSLKTMTSGAAVLQKETIDIVKTRLPDLVSISQGYGLTETALAVYKDSFFDGSHSGSNGQLIPGNKAKVVDVEKGTLLGPNEPGEFYVKGPQIMKGYLENQAATADSFDDEGYLKTGDIGYYTEDKVFYIIDRIKDLIKYKGFQVPPSELEEILLQHPDVVECGVVGAPDELAGELPTAFVMKKANAKISENELMQFADSKVSNVKKLRGGVRFLNELPKNATGKIMRRVLKQMCSQKRVSKL